MTFEDVLSKLDKKTAARVKKASEVKMERLPYYSLGITQDTGGFVRGHVHLLYGPKSSGKSLVLQQTIGMHQDRDPNFVAGWIDGEGTFDPDFAKALGVDTDRLIISHDKSFGQAQNTAVALVKAGVDMLVIDSISVLIPDAFLEKDEIKGAEGQKQMGARAKACGVLLNSIHYENDRTAVFLISQAKMNLGGLVASHMPDGGQAVNHGSTQIIKLSASAALKQQITGKVYKNGEVFEMPVGREVNYFVEKNKAGAAAGVGTYDMYYAGDKIGIDVDNEIVELAAKYKLIEKGGAGWFTVAGRKFQGADAVIDFLNSDLDYYDELKAKVLSING
jgi:recombination protein RecA